MFGCNGTLGEKSPSLTVNRVLQKKRVAVITGRDGSKKAIENMHQKDAYESP